MISSFRARVTLVVQMIVAFLAIGSFRAFSEDPEKVSPDVLPMSADSASAPAVRRLSTSIRWEGREYDIEAGIDLLMSVVRHPAKYTHPWNAATALGELANLGTQLKGRPCMDELGKLYADANDLDKGSILICFQGSGDPRGIPVFMRTLDNSQNLKLRLWAAGALAQWNVRRGVAELVKLLDSQEEMPQPSQLFYVRDNAMRTFRLKNIQKGWGFPDDKESAEWPPDVMPPPEAAARLKRPPSAGEIKKWWFENQNRFPDWKPGDPLPEVKKDSAASEPSPKP
jgi:hypothetical protein